VRTDIHRPSAIVPEDYHFVACHYIGGKALDPGECIANAEAMAEIRRHKEATGGRISRHTHGGTCHICGATAMYLAVFHHPDTNTYIEIGEDCAQKLDFGDVEAFNPLRRAIANAKAAKAGKLKAAAVLADLDLTRAWELYNAADAALIAAGAATVGTHWGNGDLVQPGEVYGRYTREYSTLCDIIGKLIRYGDLSDAQAAFLRTLLDRITRRNAIETERAAEKAAAADCPAGRLAVEGEVLKTEVRETDYGDTLKMTIKTPGGYLLWGTIPSALAIFDAPDGTQRGLTRGDRVAFVATITPSARDTKFGFYKRPAKARLLSTV